MHFLCIETWVWFNNVDIQITHTSFLPSFLPKCLTQRPSYLKNTTWLESIKVYKVQNTLNTMKIYNFINSPLGGGTLSVKFRIYVCQTSIFREGIRLLSNLFLSPYYYLIFKYIHKSKPYISYNPLFQIIPYFIL
jgi:hypothetical protein